MRLVTKSLVIGFLSISHVISFGQNSEKHKSVSVTDISINAGPVFGTNHAWNTQDFIKLAPNSRLANDDLTGYSASNYGMYSYGPMIGPSTASQVSLQLGLSFKKKDGSAMKGSPLLRLGLNYRSESLFNGYLGRTDRFAYDTLISNATGNAHYVDSVYSYSYDMRYFVQQLHVDASLVYRTNKEKRASFYGGIGMMLGLGVNPTTEISYHSSKYTEIINNSNQYTYGSYVGGYGTSEHEMEKTRNNIAFSGSLYVPLGVDLKFSTKNEFWKRVHWTFELRPSVNFFHSPEIGMLTSFSSYHGIGMRFNLK